MTSATRASETAAPIPAALTVGRSPAIAASAPLRSRGPFGIRLSGQETILRLGRRGRRTLDRGPQRVAILRERLHEPQPLLQDEDSHPLHGRAFAFHEPQRRPPRHGPAVLRQMVEDEGDQGGIPQRIRHGPGGDRRTLCSGGRTRRAHEPERSGLASHAVLEDRQFSRLQVPNRVAFPVADDDIQKDRARAGAERRRLRRWFLRSWRGERHENQHGCGKALQRALPFASFSWFSRSTMARSWSPSALRCRR